MGSHARTASRQQERKGRCFRQLGVAPVELRRGTTAERSYVRATLGERVRDRAARAARRAGHHDNRRFLVAAHVRLFPTV